MSKPSVSAIRRLAREIRSAASEERAEWILRMALERASATPRHALEEFSESVLEGSEVRYAQEAALNVLSLARTGDGPT